MIECSTKIFEITQYSNFCHLHSITHICNPLSRSKHCSNNVKLIKYEQYENTSSIEVFEIFTSPDFLFSRKNEVKHCCNILLLTQFFLNSHLLIQTT